MAYTKKPTACRCFFGGYDRPNQWSTTVSEWRPRQAMVAATALVGRPTVGRSLRTTGGARRPAGPATTTALAGHCQRRQHGRPSRHRPHRRPRNRRSGRRAQRTVDRSTARSTARWAAGRTTRQTSLRPDRIGACIDRVARPTSAAWVAWAAWAAWVVWAARRSPARRSRCMCRSTPHSLDCLGISPRKSRSPRKPHHLVVCLGRSRHRPRPVGCLGHNPRSRQPRIRKWHRRDPPPADQAGPAGPADQAGPAPTTLGALRR